MPIIIWCCCTRCQEAFIDAPLRKQRAAWGKGARRRGAIPALKFVNLKTLQALQLALCQPSFKLPQILPKCPQNGPKFPSFTDVALVGYSRASAEGFLGG